MTTLTSQPEVGAGPNRWVTAAQFLVVILGIWYGVTLGGRVYRDITEHSLAYFSSPAETTLLVVHGDMHLWQGQEIAGPVARVLPPLAGWFVELLPDDDEAILRDTIAHLEAERGNSGDVGKLRASLVVILAETGSRARAFQELEILAKDPAFLSFTRAARAIYSDTPPAPDLNRTEVCDLLSTYWPRWEFELRWLLLTQDFALSAHLTNWQRGKAKSRFHRLAAFSVLEFSACGFGLWLLAWRLLPRLGRLTPGDASPPVPWSAWEGWGLFLGTWAVGEALWTVNQYLLPWNFLDYSYLLVVGGPVLVLLYLRHGRGPMPFWKVFGLHQIQARWRFLLAVSLGLFGVQIACMSTVATVGAFVGLADRWTDYFPEDELYAQGMGRFWVFLNAVVWAPVFEEVLFRGIVYPALRVRFGVITSAALSSLLFAATHLYSVTGFIDITLFAFWGALAFEVTRSLVPCIIAHVMINLLISGTTIALYAP